jgi:hypothetical protein
MAGSGTIQDNNTLSTPKSEQEYLDALNKAVNEGNDSEVSRLMELELDFSSDADQTNSEGEPESANQADKTDQGKEGDESVQKTTDSQSTEAAPNAADTRVPEQNDNSTVQLTPEQQKIQTLEEELHRLRSDAGRIPSLQSRLAQLEAQTRQAEAIRQTVKEEQKPKESEAEKLIKQRLNALRAIDPETADLLEAMREESLSRKVPDADDLVKKFAELSTERQTDDGLRVEFDKVMHAHPDFDNIRRHPYWHMWKERLTPAERAWAESDRSEHVIEAVNQFKKMLGGYPAAAPQQPATQQVTPPAQQVDTTQNSEATDAAKQARERKLQGTTGSKDVTIKNPSGPVDEDAIYRDEFNRVMKENGLIK